MNWAWRLVAILGAALAGILPAVQAAPPATSTRRLNVQPRPIASDPSVKYDYDIVYVRARRDGDKVHKRYFPEIAAPGLMEPGADLMLLHPDGAEEVLYPGGIGSVTDPFVSIDGEWVYFAYFHDLVHAEMFIPHRGGSDIYKIHVKTRKIVQLTHQEKTPNTGVTGRTGERKTAYQFGTLNLGPCPLPGGKVVFTSSRNGYIPPKHWTPTLQLFVMDEDGSNVECIGAMNLGMALHPIALKDGRVMFSTLEGQGRRNGLLWGLWTIHPDGTGWAPMVSAFDLIWAPDAFHFQSQLSDGSIVAELYYNQNNSGFGSFFKLPPQAPEGYPQFGPAYTNGVPDPRLRWLGYEYRLPFKPYGIEVLTRFAHGLEGPAAFSDPSDKNSARVGKVTHPSGAPDNHLLCVWSPGPANFQYPIYPVLDAGIYLLKGGLPVDEPGQLLLIKNDPRYNEQFPRALVPYSRIYGQREPQRLPPLANDGTLSRHLPEGTPFGLVGTSSLYKRETYPNGYVSPSGVTSSYVGGDDPYRGLDPFTSHGHGPSRNWNNQGADAGLYSNDDIHAIRLLALEPTSYETKRRFFNHAQERFRILGEIPVRKFKDGVEAKDPDGNPDTSFLAKIPADVAFTFQTLDKNGMVLNMSQTWHQLRPGEIRNNCGGCHAHSQKPTLFEQTAAARPDYQLFDLTERTPLLTTKASDESRTQWDSVDDAGLRFASKPLSVEYYRDVRPILRRSCVACHTHNQAKPAGNLVLDADNEVVNVPEKGKFPGTYYRLALDTDARYGYKPIGGPSWGTNNASRYIRMFQSRRSLLVWKILGRRTDGFTNDDHPTETVPGDAHTLQFHGQPLADTKQNRVQADLDYTGSAMPPPEAVAGTYMGPRGQKIKVEPLTDDDRRTLIRWIDLGCPIDFDFDPARRQQLTSFGWMCDDQRPTLTLTYPRPGANAPLTRLVVGMYDYGSGLDLKQFHVRADFEVDGNPPATDLASHFQPRAPGVWEWKLANPILQLPRSKIVASVRDGQGNETRIERTFTVGPGRK
jgi:hypothetical protein